MKKKSNQPHKTWMDTLKEQLTTPVDRETFNFATELFHAAASGSMPNGHVPKPDPGRPGLYLTNIPMNRGMLAVMRETRHLSDAQRQGLTLRLMHYGETLERARDDGRFADHVKPGEHDALLVSDAFQGAYAACNFVMEGNFIRADLDHLARLLPAMERD